MSNPRFNQDPCGKCYWTAGLDADAVCDEPCPNNYWVCTLGTGHDGEHVACGEQCDEYRWAAA